MGLFDRIAGALWGRRQLADNLADEIAFHVEERTRENLARGMSPEAARRDAEQRFGNAAIVMDRTRDADVVGWLDTLVTDAMQAFRSLRRRPGLVLTTVLVLGLGIGATSAIFSVVDTVLLKPLPLPDADRIVLLREARRGEDLGGNPARLRDYRERLHTVTALMGSYGEAMTLTGRGDPRRFAVLRTFGPVLTFLGASPMLGRAFTPEEEAGTGAPVAIATERFWQRHLRGDPAVLGRSLALNGTAFTVIGVLPREIGYPENEGLIIPAAAEFQNAPRSGGNYLAMVARLAPGATLDAARREMQGLAAQFAREFPATDAFLGGTVVRLKDAETEAAREPLLALLGAVALVLVIACVNITSLLLARAAERRHEAAIRTALGAGRASLLRLYLLESGWVALGGALLGLVLAWAGVPLLRHFLPGDLPRVAEASLDWRVAGFALVASAVCGLMAGVIPAWQAARATRLHASLRDGGRSTAGPRRLLARQLLVGAQVALSMVLLVGAGLLARSLYRMRGMPTGVRPEQVLAVRLEYPWDLGSDVLHATFARALDRLGAVPGVQAVGLTDRLPLEGESQRRPILLERPDEPGTEPIADRSISVRAVSPGYFGVLGIPLIDGRLWLDRPGEPPPREVVVNRTFARRFLPPGHAVGARFTYSVKPKPGETPVWYEVVGVVGDVRQEGKQTDQPPEIWMPYQATYWPVGRFVLRTSGDPRTITSAVRAALLELDPSHVIDGITPLADEMQAATADSRIRTWLVGVFALAALLLSAIGLYGVLASDVAQRQQELGVRLALGAEPRRLGWMVVRQGCVVAVLGLAAGGVASLALGRVIATLLFGVSGVDILAFGAATLALALVALAASWIPARRATRLDPVIALRRE
ncbi:MAG TPA: ABC transporter permease [Gemmatimonadales bacterium]|nr:ABC transporter permease [Gemmatimonadales bacterium]